MAKEKHGYLIGKHKAKKLPATYYVWTSMRQRCLNSNHPQYHHYGGRGIEICPEWSEFKVFYQDMGEKPENKTLDRIDNDGGYSKENCRWATKKQQNNNTRVNLKLKYNGKVLGIPELVEALGVTKHALYHRFGRGWTDIEIIRGKRLITK